MFKIGGKIIAIESHSSGCFKKGDKFTLLDIKVSDCACKRILLKVDYESGVGTDCGNCGKEVSNSTWFFHVRFRPIDESFAEETLEMIKKFAEDVEQENLVLK